MNECSFEPQRGRGDFLAGYGQPLGYHPICPAYAEASRELARHAAEDFRIRITSLAPRNKEGGAEAPPIFDC